MLIVIGKMAYVRDFISSMTVMTLIYGLILDGGTSLLRRLSYPFNLTRRTRRWEQKILFLCCSRTCNLCRVFSDWLITRRRTTFVVGLVEHRRVSN
jgi:hypothetical protein